MNSEDISKAINDIDDAIIESANETRKLKNKKTQWIKWCAAAAIIIVIGLIGSKTFTITESPANDPIGNDTQISGADNPQAPNNETYYGTTNKLPLLVYEEAEGTAYGWEGYIAYNISELNNGNPWHEDMIFEALPVFENKSYHETGIALPGIGKESMLKKLEFSAEALDTEIQEIIIQTLGETTSGIDFPADTVTLIYGYTENCCIDISSSGIITAHFGNENGIYREGADLPENFNFTYSDTSAGEAFEIISYIYNNYSNFINIEEPTFVTWADRTFEGKENRDYRIYDFSGDELKDILNFSFNSVQISPNDEGKLMLIRINDHLSCAEKIGDYPVISADEAKDLLLEGNYITTVPYELPGEDYIAGVELLYRSRTGEKIWMPYYRFLVEIPSPSSFISLENGLKEFGVYYVPAIEMEYISGLPLWNGSFN